MKCHSFFYAKYFAVIFFLGAAQSASAGAIWVEGYTRPDGAHVPSHYLFHSHGKFYDQVRMSKSPASYKNPPIDADSIPTHARLNYAGTNWGCLRRYQKMDNQCVAIDIPDNAVVRNADGTWECMRGY